MASTGCIICGVPCRDHGFDYQSLCAKCSSDLENVKYGHSYQSLTVPFEGNGFPGSYWSEEIKTVKAAYMREQVQKLVGTTDERKALAERVISTLKDLMYPYGGYVRDTLAGEEFKDLDLFMPHKRSREGFEQNTYRFLETAVEALKAAGLTLKQQLTAPETYSLDSSIKLQKKKYTVTNENGTTIDIDLVKSNVTGAQDHPYPSLDADVNSLALDKNGKPWAVTGLPLAEVLDNIANKIFNVPSASTIKGERVNKLLAKGYRVATPIDLTSVEIGDEVVITIRTGGRVDRREAIVLRPAAKIGGSATVAFKESYASDEGYASSGFYNADIKETAKTLGIDVKKALVWEVGGTGGEYTKIEKVLKKAASRLTKETALPGTRIRCRFSSYSEYIGKTAKVVSAGPFGIKVKWEDGTVENTSFGSFSSFDFLEAASQQKEQEKVKKVPFHTLQEGDRVRLNINDPSIDYDTDEPLGEVEKEATFLFLDDNGQAVFMLDEQYETDELVSQYADDLDNGSLARYIAKKYSPGDEESQVFWSVEESSYDPTTVAKVLKHQTPPQTKSKKEEKQKTMPYDENGMKMSLLDIVQQDAGKAAIRSGATLGINGLKAGIEKLLAHEGVDGPGAQAVMKFFSGPVGEALLRGSLGYGLLYLPIPMIQENEYAQKVSEELRVSGMSKGMDKAGEMVQQFIVPALLESFKGTPLSIENLMGGGEKKEETVKPRVAEQLPAPQRVAPHVEAHDEDSVDVEFEETNRKAARAAL